jgi:hypothetical protein
MYKWIRGVSGTFNHWENYIFGGKFCLHIQGYVNKIDEVAELYGEVIIGEIDDNRIVLWSTSEETTVHKLQLKLNIEYLRILKEEIQKL